MKVCESVICTYMRLINNQNNIFSLILFIYLLFLLKDLLCLVVNLILLSVDVRCERKPHWEWLGSISSPFYLLLFTLLVLASGYHHSALAFNLLPLIKSPRPGYEFVCNFSKKYSGPTSFKSASIKGLLNTKGVNGFCSNVISIVSAE